MNAETRHAMIAGNPAIVRQACGKHTDQEYRRPKSSNLPQYLLVQHFGCWREPAVANLDQAVGLHIDLERDGQNVDGAGKSRPTVDEARDIDGDRRDGVVLGDHHEG